MKKRKGAPAPSGNEILKLKRELDNARRDLKQFKTGIPADAPKAGAAAPGHALEQQVAELEETRERLSRLYISQLEENRRRAQKLQHILSVVSEINSDLDPDTLLSRIAETIQQSLGFRIVLLRVREPGGDRLIARAFAGLSQESRAHLEAEVIHLEDFLSWLKDDFKVGHSYFISHKEPFNRILPRGVVADLGRREDWEWHPDDVLLVPLYNRRGELTAYFSVDDPVDRMVPSLDTIELLEIFGNHAVVAIENAKIYHQLEAHTRELEEATRRMKEVNALKSNFLATISHELRTPLTAIRAYVDALLGMPPEGVPADQLSRFLKIINEETQRLARLIESVLDLNRFDSGHQRMRRQPVDLAEIVADTARLLEPVGLVSQVTLKLVVEAADTRVDADRDQMRQLVLHLGGNAIKFTPAGGTTTFRLGADEREVTLRVEDTGIGIPEAALEQIFERFYQVDSSLVRRYGGTGLGLAICKSIVEWHGGRVFATSTPGHGSCFTVVLPRRTSPRVVVRHSPGLRPATEDVLKLAVEMVAEVMDARIVSVMACEPNGELVVQAATGLDERVVQDVRIGTGRGVAGWVVEQRRPVCFSTAMPHHGVAGSGRETYRSNTFLAVPIEGEKGLLGVLNVTDPVSQRMFDAEDCHMLLDLADRIANAWQQAQSLEANHAHVESATGALRRLLLHIARGRRTAPNRVRLARAIARELALTEAEIGVIGFAATVHDVGMTLVGQDTLGRGGALTPEERGRMERHAELGAELIEPIETVGAVREIVLSHHEWWDGTGYPRRLAATDIPIGARVLAVVDAYESMTLGRAHRAPVSCEDARSEIRRLKGRQFDPEVVEAFERALPGLEVQHAESAEVGDAATSDKGR
ncbi:MAG: GAF domain-containing protein [Candidatus Eisenbacteria bacterium]|uniref:histidine kinase n=1 Tax=Eiseniibacteriota bacterium TaxID=2212470 RepID=A0A538U9W0_UNCEI|nr:MAG: GAF domain-containing protein [Candidatus Eisenbacteria bacterium]